MIDISQLRIFSKENCVKMNVSVLTVAYCDSRPDYVIAECEAYYLMLSNTRFCSYRRCCMLYSHVVENIVLFSYAYVLCKCKRANLVTNHTPMRIENRE